MEEEGGRQRERDYLIPTPHSHSTAAAKGKDLFKFAARRRRKGFFPLWTCSKAAIEARGETMLLDRPE